MPKPIAYDIDTERRNCANLPNAGGYAVLYKCPSCDEELCTWLGEKELYCHHCGESIFWGVITYINSQQSEKIKVDESGIYKRGLLATVNELNEARDFPESVFIKENDDE